MQLDLFASSHDTGLRNDVIVALEQFDFSAAHTALTQLASSAPDDIALADLQRLLALLQQQATTPFTSHSEAAATANNLKQIAPCAMQMLGAAAGRKWLNRLWCESAQRASKLPFMAKDGAKASEQHAAPMYLCAQEWQAAENAVAAIGSWRRIPAPLGWMIEARYRQHGLAAVWPLLCELAWMAPSRFAALAQQLQEPLLTTLLKKFDATFEGQGDSSYLAWLPAWLLIENPALVHELMALEPVRDAAPEQAALLLRELLGLEKRGQHQAVVERRKRLQGLHPYLYGVYMKTR